MKLDGTKREILRKGIIGAYPNRDELDIYLSEQMDVQLSVIARGENYNTKVFSLIQDFEADGRIEEFIRVIVKQKPNSPYLEEIKEEFADIVAGFTGEDYTRYTINSPEQAMYLLQVLIDYFSNREKPGQHLKSLIEISDIKIDIATIDYNLPVRELITCFYARLITNEDNYLSFLKVLQSHTPAVLAATGSDRYFHR